MAIITKGEIGEQDLKKYDGKTTTFNRTTSTGGTVVLNAIGYEVDALMTYGSGSDFTSTPINNAIAAIGTTIKAVIVLKPGIWVMDANITVPSNIILKIPAGASITTTGYTLTVAEIEAGRYQIFSGTGTVSSLKRVEVDWFGAIPGSSGTAATNATAFSYAVTATNTGGELNLTPGTYYNVSGTEAVVLNKQMIVKFNGSYLNYGTNTGTALRIGGAAGTTVSDMTVHDPWVTGTSESAIGILFQNITRSQVYNPRSNVSGTAAKIYALNSGTTGANVSLLDIFGPSFYNGNIGLYIDCALNANSYVSAVNVHGGQIYGTPTTLTGSRGIEITSTNAANHAISSVRFFGTAIEPAAERKVKDAGGRNQFINCVFDTSNYNGTTITADIEYTSASSYGLIIGGPQDGLQIITNAGSYNWIINNTDSSGNMMIRIAGGSKGITLNTSGQLLVAGSAAGVTSNYNGEIVLGGTAANQFKISGDAATGATTLYVDSTYDSASANMKFRLRTAGTAVTPLELQANGAITALVDGIPNYADNAAAVAAGLAVGRLYRTTDAVKIVHS